MFKKNLNNFNYKLPIVFYSESKKKMFYLPEMFQFPGIQIYHRYHFLQGNRHLLVAVLLPVHPPVVSLLLENDNEQRHRGIAGAQQQPIDAAHAGAHPEALFSLWPSVGPPAGVGRPSLTRP